MSVRSDLKESTLPLFLNLNSPNDQIKKNSNTEENKQLQSNSLVLSEENKQKEFLKFDKCYNKLSGSELFKYSGILLKICYGISRQYKDYLILKASGSKSQSSEKQFASTSIGEVIDKKLYKVYIDLDQPQLSRSEKEKIVKDFLDTLGQDFQSKHADLCSSITDILCDVPIAELIEVHHYQDLKGLPFPNLAMYFMLIMQFVQHFLINYQDVVQKLSFAIGSALPESKSDDQDKSPDLEILVNPDSVSSVNFKNISNDVKNFIGLIKQELNEEVQKLKTMINSLKYKYYINANTIETCFPQANSRKLLDSLFANKKLGMNEQLVLMNFSKVEYEIANLFSKTQELKTAFNQVMESILKKITILENYFLFFNIEYAQVLAYFKHSNNFSHLSENFQKGILNFSEKFRKDPNIRKSAVPYLMPAYKSFILESKGYANCSKIILEQWPGVDFNFKVMTRGLDLIVDLMCNHKEYQSFKQRIESESKMILLLEEESKTKTSSLVKSKNKPSPVSDAPALDPQPESTIEASTILDDLPPLESVPSGTEIQPLPVRSETSLDLATRRLLEIKSNLLKREAKPVFENLVAKKSFKNARMHFLMLISDAEKFLSRAQQGPMSPLVVMQTIMNWIMHGSLALEQLYTALMASVNHFETMHALYAAVSHDLMAIMNECGFSGSRRPTIQELKLAENTNRGEILSRSVVRLAERYKLRLPLNKIEKLLAESYLYFKAELNIPLSRLMEHALKYFVDIQKSYYSLQRFFPNSMALSNLAQLSAPIRQFSANFKETLREFVQTTEPISLDPAVEELYAAVASLQTEGKSMAVREKHRNLLMQVYQLSAELQSTSKATNIKFVNAANILRLNQLIAEQYCYLVLEMNGVHVDPKTIDHNLFKLFVDHLGFKEEQFNSEQLNFLKSAKTVLKLARYGMDADGEEELFKVFKKARFLAKTTAQLADKNPLESEAEEAFEPTVVLSREEQRVVQAQRAVQSFLNKDMKILKELIQMIN